MSPKHGVLHDYDLWANREPSARAQKCVVCEAEPMTFQWSDYSGEAMCTRCGTPYQLKWGGEKKEAEGNYPYLNLKPEWIPIVRRYYQETGEFTCLGRMFFGPQPGRRKFYDWLEAHGLMPESEDGKDG